jgi:hypothetical protein
MAFPSTYNITYYRGDSYDFVIYPKDSNGDSFNMDGYSSLFTIATTRGPNGIPVGQAISNIDNDEGSISCRIPIEIGQDLGLSSYVYDVEIRNSSASTVYTILTGTISVTQDVSATGGV